MRMTVQDSLQQFQQKCCETQGMREEIQMVWHGDGRSVQVSGLLIYMSLVSLPSLQDHWRQNPILFVPLPAKVMTRDRLQSTFWNIQLSDPEEDVKNDRTKGTPRHDKLFRVRPLYDDILSACRLIANRGGSWQWMKGWWRLRQKLAWHNTWRTSQLNGGWNYLYWLNQAVASIRFKTYTGKTVTASEHGLSEDVVMNRIQPTCCSIFTWTIFTLVTKESEICEMDQRGPTCFCEVGVGRRCLRAPPAILHF